MKARYYQDEADEALYEFFRTHPDPKDNPVVAMPTGTGKSIVIARFIKGVLSTWSSQRIMMLTHVKELIEQNADKLRAFWPNAPLGIFSAGLNEKNASMPITFGGIQSVKNCPELFAALDEFGRVLRKIDLVIIDECHLVSDKDHTDYQKFLSALRKVNPKLRVIGLSATPYRLGLGMITDGGIFTHICYDITGLQAFNRLLDEGYLAPLIPMPTEVRLEVDGVHKRGGEFVTNELQAAVVKYQLTYDALAEAVEAADKRNHWLIFCAGIDHVRMAVEILETRFNISARAIHSKMDPNLDGNRDDNIKNFMSGKVRALVNADILTTGFDFPALDCIILLRPTSSPVLHVQILGRGTRPFYAPGYDLEDLEQRLASIAASPKQNCLVLDFAGNTQRLGPINDPRIPKRKGEGSGDIPIKMCDNCGCLNHISARFCINCGAEFIFEEKITPKASTLALIARDEPQVELFKVDSVTYQVHNKIGFPPSLKVSYFCGIRRFTEWVCLEHESSIKYKARKWWAERTDIPPPETIGEAIGHVEKLATPTQIRVWVNKKNPEILMALFEEEQANVQ